MGCWLSIEAQDAEVPASMWRSGHGEALTEAAVTNGATDWKWHAPRWGVLFEIEFPDETAREAFRALAGVQAALNAVPDPAKGLYVYPGRGGGATVQERTPRRPAPITGAMAVDEPHEEFFQIEATQLLPEFGSEHGATSATRSPEPVRCESRSGVLLAAVALAGYLAGGADQGPDESPGVAVFACVGDGVPDAAFGV